MKIQFKEIRERFDRNHDSGSHKLLHLMAEGQRDERTTSSHEEDDKFMQEFLHELGLSK